jgi:hypothetical protein
MTLKALAIDLDGTLLVGDDPQDVGATRCSVGGGIPGVRLVFI